MQRRRGPWLGLSLAAAAAMLAGVPAILDAAVAAPAPPIVADLHIGQASFWDGAYVQSGNVPPGPGDGCSAGGCFDYGVRLAPGGSRLRAAVDQPTRSNSFDIELLDPSGSSATTASASNAFNAEAFVEHPAGGVWTVRVIPRGATATSFRLRAKLEGGAQTKPAKAVPELPELRAVPPFEFGFIAPANPLNGLYPPDSVNPPLDVLGYHPASCAPDEMAQEHVSRCLRFTSGPLNVGPGPFEIRFDFVGDTANSGPPDPSGMPYQGPMDPAYQVVHWSDGHVTVRRAGSYLFHTTHGHFHYNDILHYELFKVADPVRGGLVAAGSGRKSGFCPADQLIAQWTQFKQAASGTYGEGDQAVGNCQDPSNGTLGLSTGWGDIYRWQRPGQYVDFGNNGDGYYVVQVLVDPLGHVLEADHTKDVSYAFIHVVGDNVALIERGFGASPWDASKTVVPPNGSPRGDGPPS